MYHIINIYICKLHNCKKFFYKVYKTILDYSMYNKYKIYFKLILYYYL